MSRIAAFLSAAPRDAAAIATAMLAAMPRGSDVLKPAKRGALAWSGRTGGGAYAGEGLVVALDGEIFNLDALAGGLGEPAQGDAHAFALLYRRYRFERALDRVRGDFAVALVDERAGRLWLGRDPVGLKPLYYARGTGWIACASQPAALLGVPDVRPAINRKFAALIAGSHYRTFDNAPDESPFEDVRQLPAGHFVEAGFDGGASPPRRYWTLQADRVPAGSEAQLAEQYRHLLLQAVKRRLPKAARPCFTLSGGMDSSSVLCCAAEASARKQHAFSSVYTDPTFDERAEIQDVVKARVEQWHAVELGKDLDVLGAVAKLVAVHNEPVATATWLAHEFVCEAVRAVGFDALFGGLGGDELNAGEYEYFPMFFADLEQAGRREQLAREVERWAAYHDHPIYRKDAAAARQAVDALTVPGTPGKVRPNRERLLRYAGTVRPEFHDLASFEPVMEHPFRSYLANRAYQDLTRETTPCCLRAEDRQATAAGLRHYDPFLDRDVVEFMFAAPGSLKIREGVTKHLLREAMRGILPEATRTRVKKTGWNAPAHVWFSGRQMDAVRDLVASRRFRERGIYNIGEVERLLGEHERIVRAAENRENHMMFIWQLVNLDAWLSWVERRP